MNFLQAKAGSFHNQFVHLGNLPDDGYRELEAVCVGLRFGKVNNYVVLKNRNKASEGFSSPIPRMFC